jgi:branched-chain amino acid transport system ATP-binding protein
MTLLEVTGLVSGYKSGAVLDGVDLSLEDGGSVAVLGRNGVGKSTFVNTLMGLIKPTAGSVRVAGTELAGARTDVIARAGVSITPQGRRIFGPLTVRETLELSATVTKRAGPWTIAKVVELFPRLGERMGQRSAQLSGGEQQMLVVARALLANPALLLLDEPSDGLAPAVVRQIEAVLLQVRSEGIGIVLVEQDLRCAFHVADDVRIMEKGRFVHTATVADFRRDRPTAQRLLGVG